LNSGTERLVDSPSPFTYNFGGYFVIPLPWRNAWKSSREISQLFRGQYLMTQWQDG